MNQYQQLGFNQPSKEFRGRSAFIVQLWWIVQSTLFLWSPQVIYGWRNFLLRLFGAEIGSNVRVRSTARFTFPWKITLGDYSRVGDDVVLYSLDRIVIGNHTVISQRSYLCTGSHNYRCMTFDLLKEPIVISDQVWVAADVFIAPGVHVGKGTVIGARSSVWEDLPEGMVCVGNPAKPVKSRTE